jgi:hypothetical protein
MKFEQKFIPTICWKDRVIIGGDSSIRYWCCNPDINWIGRKQRIKKYDSSSHENTKFHKERGERF